MSDGLTYGVKLEASSNVAEVAKDAGASLDDLKKSTGNLDNETRQMAGGFDLAANKIGIAFAGSVTAAGAALVALTRNGIEAADALNDLHLKTGISVESLAGWDFVAKQNGTTVNAMALALRNASNYMVDHADKLRAIGITGKTSEEVLLQLSNIISRLPADDPRRVAVAMDVLGRSAQDMLPMLSEGEEKLRAMLDRGKELNPVTAEMARQADQFNDRLAELKASASGFGIALAKDLLPHLNKLVEQMVEGQRIFGSFSGAMFTASTMNPFQSWGEHAKSLRAEIAGLEEKQKQFSASNADTSAIDMAIATARKKLEWAKYNQNQEALALLPPGGYRDEGARGLPDQPDPLAGYGKEPPKAKHKADPNDAALKSLQAEQFREEMKLLGVAAEQVRVYEMAMHGATEAQIEAAQAAANAIAPVKAEMEARKQAASAAEKAAHDASIAQEKEARDAAAKQKRQAADLINEKAHAALAEAAAGQTDKSASARELRRFKEDIINYQARLDRAKLHHTLTLEEEEAFRTEYEAIINRHQNAKAQADSDMVQFGKSLREGEYVHALDTAEKMSAGLATHSRAMFEINKVAGTAKAIIRTHDAVAGVMEEFPGPVGWAMAAVQAAMGFAEVAAIQGTQFGGGGAVGGGGGIPSLATTPGVPVYPVERPLTAASAPAPAPQQFNLTIVGAKYNPDAPLLSYNAVVNDLLPLIKKAASNGHGVNNVAMG